MRNFTKYLIVFFGITEVAQAVRAETHTFEAEAAASIGGVAKMADNGASGHASMALMNSGQGITFARLPAASKLAIHYASLTTARSVSPSTTSRRAR